MFGWLKKKASNKSAQKSSSVNEPSAKKLTFKSNVAAYEFALGSLLNGFGTMNFLHAGIITSKSFDVKKEKQKKIQGDVEDVINEISKYNIKVAFKGKEINTVGTRTVNISSENPAVLKKGEEKFNIGDLVAVTDLSHSLMDKMSGKERDDSADFQFEIMGKMKPIFNADRMDFEK